MSVLDRKLIRELVSSGRLLMAITSIMAVGVACYVALGFAFRNLATAQRRYYEQCRMADFSVEVKKAPWAELEAVARLKGVVEVRPRVRSFVTLDMPNKEEPINGLVLSMPDDRTPVIDDIVLRRGGYFTLGRANEVIVNDAFARRHHLYPGSHVYMLLNNQRQELFVVGTAVSSEFTYLVGPGSIVPDPELFGVFYIKQTYADLVFDFDGAANQVLGRLAPDLRDHPEQILRRAERLLEPFGVFGSTPLKDQASNRFLSNEIQGLEAFGIINPAIFLSVAALVLNVLMSRLAEQQRVLVGTLKALGYSNAQVFGHFIKFGLAIGLASGILGAGLGFWLADAMTGMYRRFFEFPQLENRFYAPIAIQGLLISLVCALAGSVHGARGVLRLAPAEAMRPKPPARGGAIRLERIAWFWRRLNFGWRMTLRDLFRHRFRSAAGMFAASMGSCLMVNALMLVEATNYMIDFQFREIQRSDIDVAFKDEHGIDALQELLHLPGVDQAEGVFDVACTFSNGSHSHKGGITGLAPGARLTIPRDQHGRPLSIRSTGLTMSRKMAHMLHLSRGDVVAVRPVKGLRELRDVRVAEVADSYIGLAVYADIHFLSRLVHEELAINGAQLMINPSPAARRSLYRELKHMPGVQAVTARARTIASVMDTLVKNQRVFIGLLVMFAGVIFFGSVLNSSLISLAERQREVATLRVLGYTEWQVGAMFLRDGLIVNSLGTIAGLPLGYLLNVGITVAYDTEMFRIPVVNPFWICVQALVLGTLFGLAAYALVQWSIHRADWLEALKTKE